MESRLHVIPAFHYDVAYCKTFRDYLGESLGNIQRALELLRTDDAYTYCIEQVILLREYWRRHPADRADLKRFAQAGRLTFAPGMFTMPDSNIPSGENFVRNALLGRRWLRRHLGVVPRSCWMADIFGHNPQSPQLATTCGYDSYVFERGKTGPWETTFRWQGLDGTAIAAHWQVDTYYGITLGLAWLSARPWNWVKRRIEREVIGPLQQYAAEPACLMTSLGGDFLKPEPTHLEFVKRWNRRADAPKMIFSSQEAYFDELRARGVELPVRKEDMNPLCEGCNAMRIRIKQCNRRLEEKAATLELLESMAGRPHRGSAALWEVLAWNAFHDIICGSLVRKAVEEALAKYARAEERADARIAEIMQECASRSSRGGKTVPVAFNSLPYARIAIVEHPKAGPVRVALPACGMAVLAANISGPVSARNRVRISAKKRSLENGRVRVVFGANGTICSLVDKRSGHEYACPRGGMNNPIKQPDGGDPWNVSERPFNGSLLRTAPKYDPAPPSGTAIEREGRIGTKAADADCFDWPEMKIVRDHPLEGIVEFSYPALRFTTRISLRAQESLVRFQSRFMPSWKHYRLRIAFPTNMHKGRIRHSVPCGHIRRPEGEYACQGWMDYADREKGLLLLNRGLPGNNVTDGVMLLSLFRGVSMESAEGTPWYEGGIAHEFDYALAPFTPGDPTYNPAREAALFNRPPVILDLALPRGGIPEVSEPFIELVGPAELTCIRRIGRGTYEVRIWETSGRRGRVRLRFRGGVRDCVKTTAAGDTVAAVPVAGGELSLRLRGFEIATLRLSTDWF